MPSNSTRAQPCPPRRKGPRFLTKFPPTPPLSPPLAHPSRPIVGTFLSHQDLPTHLSRSAPFLSPDEYTVPITPSLDPCPQTQAISNPDGLDFGLPLVEESLSLPSADLTTAYDPTWGDCKPTSSYPRNLVPLLTICDIVLLEPSPSDPVGFNLPSSNLIAVSGSIISVSVICLHDSVGYGYT